MLTFLLIDDHDLVRDGIRPVLEQLDRGNVLILEANCLADAKEQYLRYPEVDLVLLDLGLPDAEGLDVLADATAPFGDTPIVVLSADDDAQSVKRSLDAGAMGFVPKNSPTKVIAGALRLVLSGGIYIPPELLAAAQDSSPRDMAPPARAKSADQLGLTERQIEVLSLLAQGKSNKVVSRELGVTPGTVKNHVAAILRALQVCNRIQAAALAQRFGLSRLAAKPDAEQRRGDQGMDSR